MRGEGYRVPSDLALSDEDWEGLRAEWEGLTKEVRSAREQLDKVCKPLAEEKEKRGQYSDYDSPVPTMGGPTKETRASMANRPWDETAPGEWKTTTIFFDRAKGGDVIRVIRISPGENAEADAARSHEEDMRTIRRATVEKYLARNNNKEAR